MEDKEVKDLIQISIEDPERKELYLNTLPKMTGAEKLELTLDLWRLIMEKLEYKVQSRKDRMIEEMANNSDVVYEPADFDALYGKVLNEYLKSRVSSADEDELEALRKELDEIGEKVQEHDQVLSEIAKKFSAS